MTEQKHTSLVRTVCWHSSNPRIIASGGNDSTVRIWRLYRHGSAFVPLHHNNETTVDTTVRPGRSHTGASKISPEVDNHAYGGKTAAKVASLLTSASLSSGPNPLTQPSPQTSPNKGAQYQQPAVATHTSVYSEDDINRYKNDSLYDVPDADDAKDARNAQTKAPDARETALDAEDENAEEAENINGTSPLVLSDDENELIAELDESLQPLRHLLSMPASGSVESLQMSPFDGNVIVCVSSRYYNSQSSLDIFNLPHWTWNYNSSERLPYRVQLKKYKEWQKRQIWSRNKAIRDNTSNASNASDESEMELELDATEEQANSRYLFESTKYSPDFVDYPTVVPLPYGARERALTWSPNKYIVFVGLISCRHKHKRRYCCLMACNISNGASRPCSKINALFHRRESVLSLALSNDEKSFANTDDLHDKQHNSVATKKRSNYKLAIGTNEGRLIIVTLNEDLDWESCRESFIREYTVAHDVDPTIDYSIADKTNGNMDTSAGQSNSDVTDDSENENDNDIENEDDENQIMTSSMLQKRVSTVATMYHQKLAVKSRRGSGLGLKDRRPSRNSGGTKFSVLTAREKCFREMADPERVTITFQSMKQYLWSKTSDVDERDMETFFKFMEPNEENEVSFGQFCKIVDEDGNFMKAFQTFLKMISPQRNLQLDDYDGDDDEQKGDARPRSMRASGGSSSKRKKKANATRPSRSNTDPDENEARRRKKKNMDRAGGGGDGDEWNSDTSYSDEPGLGTDDAVSCLQWSHNNEWIITGHVNGEIKFYNKHFFINPSKARHHDRGDAIAANNKDEEQEELVQRSPFYYQFIGALKRHSGAVTSLSISGTYLVSSSNDGSILVWHLDFLLPSLMYGVKAAGAGGAAQMGMDDPRLQMSHDMIQMLANLKSAHLGDEVNDTKLSNLSIDANVCIPNALYMVSVGSDNHVRCRDVMEIFRQQLSRVMQETSPNMNEAMISRLNEENEMSSENSDVSEPLYN